MARAFAILPVLIFLSACGGSEGLRPLRASSGGPDEFTVLPSAPLEMPSDLSRLPAPTPGVSSRVDATPKADAIAALGGRASAAFAGGIPATDAALVAAANRHGTAANIRQTLAAEDAQLRAGAGRFMLPFVGGDRYFRAYSGQKLDAYAELERLRAMGVETPTAPPLGR